MIYFAYFVGHPPTAAYTSHALARLRLPLCLFINLASKLLQHSIPVCQTRHPHAAYTAQSMTLWSSSLTTPADVLLSPSRGNNDTPADLLIVGRPYEHRDCLTYRGGDV